MNPEGVYGGEGSYRLWTTAAWNSKDGKVWFTDVVAAKNETSARNKTVAKLLETEGAADYEGGTEALLEDVTVTVRPF